MLWRNTKCIHLDFGGNNGLSNSAVILICKATASRPKRGVRARRSMHAAPSLSSPGKARTHEHQRLPGPMGSRGSARVGGLRHAIVARSGLLCGLRCQAPPAPANTFASRSAAPRKGVVELSPCLGFVRTPALATVSCQAQRAVVLIVWTSTQETPAVAFKSRHHITALFCISRLTQPPQRANHIPNTLTRQK
jgi:hypothetical protein